MYTAKLFLGFPVDSAFAEKIAALDQDYLSLFIQNNETYLKEINYDNIRYLGKFTTEMSDLSSLKLLEANIYSLLKKLVPNHPYLHTSLYLFPLLEEFTAAPYAHG